MENAMMATVKRLAVPRSPGTADEREAGEYLGGRLRELGLNIREEHFPAPSTFSWVYLLLYVLPGAAVGVAAYHPGTGVVLALVGFLLFYLELEFREVLGHAFRWSRSSNVIGRRGQAEDTRQRVVLMAHRDSSKAALNFRPGLVEGFRRSFLGMAGAYLLTPILLAAYAASDAGAFWWLSFLPAGYLLLSAGFLLHREIANQVTPGANDNASGVAVVLALVETWVRTPPQRLELWAVITGAEESGTWGVANLLRRHGRELRDALFLNFDNVGAGQVHYIDAEGALRPYPASPRLLVAAETVREQRPDLKVSRAAYRLLPTDATRALAWGYQAMSFLATDERGLLPNWHWLTDTPDGVDPECLRHCHDFAWELVLELDRRAGQGCSE
jgi:hypothetical protein